ncbi:MAG TPA: response regulator [Stenomitos sp.]
MVRDCNVASPERIERATVRILLVEDSAAEARLLLEILRGSRLRRFSWAHVNRLAEAVRLLDAEFEDAETGDVETTPPFDLILLDLTLPDSYGLASLDVLQHKAPKLPIVVLTNTNDDELAVEAIRRGAQDYLVKRHLNQDVLVRSLGYAIERKQAAEALKDVNLTLELRVQERTAELKTANDLLKQEIAQKQLLEAQFLQAQRLESLGTLASGIAHDLNNILTPMLAVAQILPLKVSNLDDRTEKLLGMLETGARRGAELIQQILSFARGLEGKRMPIQLKHLLSEVQQIVRQTLPRLIEICIDLPSNLWTISGDATQLHQIFMNLCVNARDAMPHGGKLTISAKNCFVDELFLQRHIDARVGPYVAVTISDTGIGMPPEIMERIFDPFFTTKEIGKGTGLGLSAVLGIVKSHEGFIDIQSEVGKGSRFVLYLPAKQASELIPEEESLEEFQEGQNNVILVVDDEPAICTVIETVLEAHNYRIIATHDSTEAVALYAHHKDQICLVLTNLMMPYLDGPMLLSLLKQIQPNLRVVAMSGLNTLENRSHCEKLGFQGWLSKPFTTKELMRSIHSALPHTLPLN